MHQLDSQCPLRDKLQDSVTAGTNPLPLYKAAGGGGGFSFQNFEKGGVGKIEGF